MSEILYVERWLKACKCEGTSSTQRLRVGTPHQTVKGYAFSFTFVPDMSCDTCGEPWNKERPDDAR